MVKPDKEHLLDDVILKVFEGQGQSSSNNSHDLCAGGRHFYFPVTSQNEARAFVREIHSRGVQYSRICAAVGALEQNFTAWRTGVSRPGIGNRVVERINRPLQEFLLAADDDSDLLDSSSELDLKLLSDLEEADEADVLVQFSLSTLSGVDTASLNKSAASRTSPGPVGEVAAGRQGRAVQKSGGSHATTARAEQNNVISTDMVDHCQMQPAGKVVQPNSKRTPTKNEENNNNNSNKNKKDPSSAESPPLNDPTNDGHHFSNAAEKAAVTIASAKTIRLVNGGETVMDREEGRRTENSVLERKNTTEGNHVRDNTANDDEVTRGTQTQRRRDSWVTELSVNLTADCSETGSGHQRQITTFTSSSSSSSSATAAARHSDQTVIGNGTEEATTVANYNDTVENLVPDSNNTEFIPHPRTNGDAIFDAQPEVNGHMTSSQPEVVLEEANDDSVADHSNTITTTTTGDVIFTDNDVTCDVITENDVGADVVDKSDVITTTFGSSSDFVDNTPPEVDSDGHLLSSSKPEIHTTVTAAVDRSAEPEVVVVAALLLDRQEMTSMTDVTVTSWGPEVTLEAEPEVVTSSTAEVTSEVKPKVMTPSGPKVAVAAAPDVVVTSSTAAKPAALESKPEIVTSSADIVGDRKCVLRERRKEKDGGGNADDCGLDDVDENYNSSEDNEDDENDNNENADDDVDENKPIHLDRRRGRRRGRKFGRRRQGQLDGPGYVYVFTDTAVTNCSSDCRVKISASRCPEARLRQAQLFNLDIRLVSAVQVSCRLSATLALRQRLADCAVARSTDWFSAPLDRVINAVMDVSRLYSTTVADDIPEELL